MQISENKKKCMENLNLKEQSFKPNSVMMSTKMEMMLIIMLDDDAILYIAGKARSSREAAQLILAFATY